MTFEREQTHFDTILPPELDMQEIMDRILQANGKPVQQLRVADRAAPDTRPKELYATNAIVNVVEANHNCDKQRTGPNTRLAQISNNLRCDVSLCQ